MRTRRFIGFAACIILGLAAGLIYGWMIHPARFSGTSLDTLRSDYKADYILMVAEVYGADGNTAAALEYLTELDAKANPGRLVQEAILTGQQLGYPRDDIERLARLFQAIETWQPTPKQP